MVINTGLSSITKPIAIVHSWSHLEYHVDHHSSMLNITSCLVIRPILSRLEFWLVSALSCQWIHQLGRPETVCSQPSATAPSGEDRGSSTGVIQGSKLYTETIDIISQFIEDANLNGDPQVHKINSNYTCTCFYIMPSIAHITLIDGNWRPNDLQEHQGWKVMAAGRNPAY